MDYKIRDFSHKMAFKIQNSGLIVSLKHQKTHPQGRVSFCIIQLD